MKRLVAIGLVLLASAAYAGPPSESVSVYPATQTEPPTTPVVLLQGTTVPACPTACDAPCTDTGRPGLFNRRAAEPKTVCCDSPPRLDAVLTRVLPVTPCVPPVCTNCGSTCGDKSCGTTPLRGLMNRPTRTTSCETCSAQSDAGCWSKFKAWLTYRSGPSVVPCLQPNPYQPSVFAYVKCKEETNPGGCGSNCSKGCNAGGTVGPRCGNSSTVGSTGCATGQQCGSGAGLGLFDRIAGSFGLGSRGEASSTCSTCTGDGSHRISEAGRHVHLVRDCSGAPELAGTQLTPGFRFAGAEQIRLYGNNMTLPTSNPHWPVQVGEGTMPATEKSKTDSPKPMTDKPMTDKPKVEDKLPEPKKTGGSPTASTTGLSVNRPFTNP